MATDPNRFGKRQSVNLEQADSRVGLAQLTAIGIIAIFILAAVLYGLTGEHLAGGTIHNANSQVTSQGGAQQTTQPAASNPANPSQGAPQPGLAQPAAPSQNAAAPGGISNPPTTSGQGH
jgi:hypothetical protein